MSDSSDSEIDKFSKKKTEKSTFFDNNVFDTEESNEKNKSTIHHKKKINQQYIHEIKTSVNNEQIKNEKLIKVNDKQSATKKKITLTKTTDKKKSTVNLAKNISKMSKTTHIAQKRPSTDESNESIKKVKLDDEKSKTISIEEHLTSTTIPTEIEISASSKPSIVLPSSFDESCTDPFKSDQPATETNIQTTSTKFGIVFASHHRYSATTSSPSTYVQPTEKSVDHETSKNIENDTKNDNELLPTIHDNNHNENNNYLTMKDEQLSSNTNTLKLPSTAQPPLSDDEALNPETMQLSDLIGASRHDGAKFRQSSSTTKTTGKEKRISKQDTSTKRQQTKTDSRIVQSTVANEIEIESLIDSVLLSSTKQLDPISTNTKRSSAKSSTVRSSIDDKESKRLRSSTNDTTIQLQDKRESTAKVLYSTKTQITEDSTEQTLPIETNKKEILPLPTIDQLQVTSMETDQIPLSSSIITSTHSPLTTRTDTENAIKALYSSIQIPQQSLSKAANLEKSSPIIAPISKETLPIVEHQPNYISTTSIVTSHVPNTPIKSSLQPATLSRLLSLNQN